MIRLANPEAGKLFSTYVAYLRALYQVHQNNHWQVKGKNFYSQHLLFQRLYEAVASDTDTAAEKAVGLFGSECMNLSEQAELIKNISTKYASESFDSSEDMYLLSSIAAEKNFTSLSDEIYSKLEQMENLTLGLDDLIMSLASNSEERLYLLQQNLA